MWRLHCKTTWCSISVVALLTTLIQPMRCPWFLMNPVASQVLQNWSSMTVFQLHCLRQLQKQAARNQRNQWRSNVQWKESKLMKWLHMLRGQWIHSYCLVESTGAYSNGCIQARIIARSAPFLLRRGEEWNLRRNSLTRTDRRNWWD